MTLNRLTIEAPAGNFFVAHWKLAYADIVSVKRNGQREYLVEAKPTGTATNVYHNVGLGRLEWSEDRLFNHEVMDDNGYVLPEFIHILYK
jgi:hypothetical protein